MQSFDQKMLPINSHTGAKRKRDASDPEQGGRPHPALIKASLPPVVTPQKPGFVPGPPLLSWNASPTSASANGVQWTDTRWTCTFSVGIRADKTKDPSWTLVSALFREVKTPDGKSGVAMTAPEHATVLWSPSGQYDEKQTWQECTMYKNFVVIPVTVTKDMCWHGRVMFTCSSISPGTAASLIVPATPTLTTTAASASTTTTTGVVVAPPTTPAAPKSATASASTATTAVVVAAPPTTPATPKSATAAVVAIANTTNTVQVGPPTKEQSRKEPLSVTQVLKKISDAKETMNKLEQEKKQREREKVALQHAQAQREAEEIRLRLVKRQQEQLEMVEKAEKELETVLTRNSTLKSEIDALKSALLALEMGTK